MALISCPECNSSVSDKATGCPQCGFPINTIAPVTRASSSEPPQKFHTDYVRPEKSTSFKQGSTTIVKSAKSRGIYIILGLLLGGLGIHNFYAGYYGRGLAQLLTVLILGWFVIGLVIVGVWIIIELFTVTHDAAGDEMV